MSIVLECNAADLRTSYDGLDGLALSEEDWSRRLTDQFGVNLIAEKGALHGSRLASWSLGDVTAIDVRLGTCELHAKRCSRDTFTHDHLLLKLVLSGSLGIEQRGRSCSLTDGDIVVLDPDISFAEWCPDGVRLAVLWLSKRALRGRGISTVISSLHVPGCPTPETGVARDLISSVLKYSSAVTPKFGARMGQQMLDMMDILLTPRSESLRDSVRTLTLQDVKRYLQRHFGDSELTADSIAEEVRLSANYLNRLFRAEGTSLMRYLWAYRLDQAAAMLVAHPEMQIGQVAYRCGFSDTAHFSRAYRERFGARPSDAPGRKPSVMHA